MCSQLPDPVIWNEGDALNLTGNRHASQHRNMSKQKCMAMPPCSHSSTSLI
jgi:hypothetical protein